MKVNFHKINLSVVIPIHNEEEVIDELVKRIIFSCRIFRRVQIIFVEDGSTDNSWLKIKNYASFDSRIIGLRMTRNFGHQKAVLAGLNECDFENIVIIDGDLQDPPELIKEMVKVLIETGVDVVYGVRSSRQGETLFKRITAKTFYRLFSRIVPFKIPIDVGDFRVMKKKVLSYVLQSRDPAPFIRGLFAHLGFSSKPFFYVRQPRFAGKTKYSFRKMFLFASTAIFGFSELPYKIFLRVAIISLVITFGASSFSLFHALSGEPLAGWTSLFLLSLYMGSINFLFLTLIAKYLTLNFEILLTRPRWVISERTD